MRDSVCKQVLMGDNSILYHPTPLSTNSAAWAAPTCWQDVHAMALSQGEHVRASGDEGLLVGQADVLSSLDGGAGGLQPSTADDACRRAKGWFATEEKRRQLLTPQCLAVAVETQSYLAILLTCDDCSWRSSS